MKIIAVQVDDNCLVQMSTSELRELAGFYTASDFDAAYSCSTQFKVSDKCAEQLLSTLDIPVSGMFAHAQDTIAAYKTLKSKFESIRNQLTTLMKKMALIAPRGEI